MYALYLCRWQGVVMISAVQKLLISGVK